MRAPQAKPEITLNTTTLIATAAKIAAHLALTQESIADWDAFTSSATTELQRLVIDEENAQILGWLDVPGILTHAAAAAPAPPATTFDDLEQCIAKLRVGSSLATADLLVLNPDTWSSIRRQKDTQGRYLATPDPTVGEASSAWGVPVVTTTACPTGEGWMLDTSKFGRLAVRESLTVRMGFANDDLIKEPGALRLRGAVRAHGRAPVGGAEDHRVAGGPGGRGERLQGQQAGLVVATGACRQR